MNDDRDPTVHDLHCIHCWRLPRDHDHETGMCQAAYHPTGDYYEAPSDQPQEPPC
jgi:hypothetical protein